MSTDADLVVYVLDRCGPRSLGELGDHPALTGWSRERLEEAVVQAWTGNQLNFDFEDHLVAL
jgi:hypothetical protein